MSPPAGQPAQIRLLLIEDVAQVSQFVRGLLAAQSQVKLLDVITDGEAAIGQIRELRPDVIVVDALLRGKMNGLEVAQQVRQEGFDIPIICLTVPHKPVSVGEGMGLARVLTMPFSGYDFINLVKQLHAEQMTIAPTTFSKIYAIYGAKGGVGTTTLAYNIGAAMAARGQHSVALVDGSLQFADLRALLQVGDDVASLLHLPTNKLTQADVGEVAWRDKSGMDVLFAPPRPEMSEMVSPADMTKLLALLRRLYNVVLVDTPTSVADTSLAMLDAADRIVVVLAFEKAALHQTRAMAETFARIGYPRDKLMYLLNRSNATGGLSPESIDRELGRPADFAVVSDGALVLAANNRAEPFVLASPSAQISRDVANVAEALTSPARTGSVARAASGS